jgi:hypothetical protein
LIVILIARLPFRLRQPQKTRDRRFGRQIKATPVSEPPERKTKRPFDADNHEHGLPSTMTANREILPTTLDMDWELPSFAVQDDGKSRFNLRAKW